MSDDEIPELVEHTELDNAPGPSSPAVPDEKRVPLTIICGFLGAGKSTLLKRILTERHGYRIAVIMNEFGDTADIESRAINVSSEDDPSGSNTSEEFLELANGCLCCSLKDAGAAAIEKLMQRKGAFDHILLETTGLADPGPIASTFWQNEEYSMGLGKDIALDGVVCVVDAVFGLQQMNEDKAVDGVGESLRQIAGSDVIILNKTDLVSPDLVTQTEEVLKNVNPSATVHRAIRCDIDLEHLMGISAFSSARQLEFAAELASLERGQLRSSSDTEGRSDKTPPEVEGACTGLEHAEHEGHHHHHQGATTHYEMRGISSIKVNIPVMSPARLDALDAWLRSVLWEGSLPESFDDTTAEKDAAKPKLEILRCKGLFVMQDGARHMLQGVRNLYEITEIIPLDGGVDPAKVEERDEVLHPEVGKLVLIGKGLNEEVRKSLEATVF